MEEIPPALRQALADTAARDYGQSMERFSREMVTRFYDKALAGRRGWDDPKCYIGMASALQDSVNKMNWVDVANFAMFLWNLDEFRKQKEED